jgi:hypothetical protein
MPPSSGKMESVKTTKLHLLPFGKMSSMISLHPVKKIVIIVFLVPMAYRVLGTTFVGDRAHILEGG